ncbi:MAG: flavin reductase family protein [Candidatus Thorarchaeota archaeon]
MEQNLLSPLPVVLVGTLVDGQPNFLVTGYSAPFYFGKHIFFSLYPKRFTHTGIHQNKTFSVNIPSVDLLDETRICGSKSGRDFDKSSLFDVFYGETETAPMIQQCPICIECELSSVVEYPPHSEGIIGRVVRSDVDSECLIDGNLDIRKVNPIIWAIGGDDGYYQLGERIGDV